MFIYFIFIYLFIYLVFSKEELVNHVALPLYGRIIPSLYIYASLVYVYFFSRLVQKKIKLKKKVFETGDDNRSYSHIKNMTTFF